MTKPHRIALIGFGQVGRLLAADLIAAGASELAAFDIAFADPTSAPSLALDGAAVRDCASAAEAARGAELVISAVAPGQALEAARGAALGIERGAYYLDLNAASPSLKQLAAGAIEARGGRYVEAAAMGDFAIGRIATPLLLGGRYAFAFLDLAKPLGFSGAMQFSEQIGKAAAAAACAEVVTRGLQATLLEALLAARRHGVESIVLGQLHTLAPGADWRAVAETLVARASAAPDGGELAEAARALEETGVAPLLTRAALAQLRWAAEQGRGGADLIADLDRLLGRIDAPRDV